MNKEKLVEEHWSKIIGEQETRGVAFKSDIFKMFSIIEKETAKAIFEEGYSRCPHNNRKLLFKFDCGNCRQNMVKKWGVTNE